VKSHWKVHLLCALYKPGEWLWEDSNSTDGKPTFHRRANLSWLSAICIHLGEIAVWSRKSLTMFTYLMTFLEKKSPYWQICKNDLQKDSPSLRSTSCVQISWNLADRKSVKSCVVYLPKKKQFRLALPLLLLRGSHQKSVRDSFRQYSRSAPSFIQIRSLPAEL